ncbi:MAG: sulfotransferase [Candidatus Dormibacteria bacterium]
MTTVLYIAGTGRSGSTVLAGVLGEVEGVFAAGEVRYLWQRGLIEGRLCGCGAPVRDCPRWGAILEAATRGGVAMRPEAMAEFLVHAGRVRHLPGSLVRKALPMQQERSTARAAARATLSRLYPAIAQVTASQVVVDSSKLPAYALLLADLPGIDLRVVHLVRDPRGAAYSWSTRKALTDGATQSHMEQMGALKSAALWDVWNVAASGLLGGGDGRYLRLRYEDFVADPAAAVRRILSLAGLAGSALPFDSDAGINLRPNHMVAGNPDRLRHGPIRLRVDARWRSAMPGRDRRVVNAVAAPLLALYGYPIRAGTSGELEATIFDRAPSRQGGPARFIARVRRHLHWARSEGVGRLVEEDELNPGTKLRVALEKRRWRRSHPTPAGQAMPVFVVGLQRSGTNMLTRGLDRAPEFEVHSENDRAAFDRFLLRSDETIGQIVARSRHRFVLFKPLCDSHRVDDLLDRVRTRTPGRAIWVYRDVDGRVRSAVSKFGRNNLLVLADIAAGRAAGAWQAQRLPASTVEVISSFDYHAMSPETAAALFWWVRNGLYFELGLDRRPDVMLASYDDLLSDPRAGMEAICSFLGLDYRPELIAHITPRSGSRAALDIDPRVRRLCDQLHERMDTTLRRQRQGEAA